MSPIKLRCIDVKFLVVMVLAAGLAACSPRDERRMHQAEAFEKNKQYLTALESYEEAIKASVSEELILKMSLAAAHIAQFETKDFERALKHYRHAIYFTTEAEQALLAQTQIVKIYVEHLNSYDQAIVELNKLIQVETNPDRKIEHRLLLARSYFHMRFFDQALAELDQVLKAPKSQGSDSVDQNFEIKLLRANILTAEKKPAEAVAPLKELIEKYRSRAIKENVPTLLAVAYEELKDFKSAQQILESVRAEHPIPEFIDFRLKSIKDRMKNQPKTKMRISK
jgi:tetratricopeptide (TPR) repeat protein